MPTPEQVVELVTRFENNFNTGDLDALMDAMTEDTVFEHIAPGGASFGRHEGQDAVRAVWASLPQHFPDARFQVDDIFATADRCTCRYTMSFNGPDGSRVSARGVDVFRIRDGRIAEKLTYMTL